MDSRDTVYFGEPPEEAYEGVSGEDKFMLELLTPILERAFVRDYTMVVGFFKTPPPESDEEDEESLSDTVQFHCNVIGPSRMAYALVTLIRGHLEGILETIRHETLMDLERPPDD